MFDFLSDKFSSVFSSLTGQTQLTEKNIDEAMLKIKEALLEADVPYDLVEKFSQDVSKAAIGQKVVKSVKPSEQFMKLVHDEMLKFLGGQYLQESFTFVIPSVVMVMGLQGSGKTTSLGKLATFIQNQAAKRNKKRKILCASVDFYRPAAIDQLEILAGQVGADFYRATSANPVQAASEIMSYFKQHGYEVLLFDTAGRLHVDETMMAELKAVYATVKPKYTFLVLDAMTGQESLTVASSFEKTIGFDYAILSKMDSDARGGAAFSFRYALKKPILFMGTGEKLDNLEIFRPERIANRMLGMGDILTLIENAESKIQKSEQERLEKSFKSGVITLDDFAQQLSVMNKMGSLASLMKYLPGMGNMAVSQADLEKGEVELKRFRAIMSSMTKKERLSPQILDASRKSRIAKGSGVQVADVNNLLQRFEQSKQFVKLFKKNKFFD